MDNKIKFEEVNYFIEYLASENSIKSFLYSNKKLMEGFYINNEKALVHTLIEDYYNILRIYFDTFYGLVLRKERKRNNSYYYLSFKFKQ